MLTGDLILMSVRGRPVTLEVMGRKKTFTITRCKINHRRPFLFYRNTSGHEVSVDFPPDLEVDIVDGKLTFMDVHLGTVTIATSTMRSQTTTEEKP